jgi:nitrite reductase/ring-hydroxylating ferredoxin subunit
LSHLVKVGTLSELPPGTGRQVQVEDRVMAIFNIGGTIHAIGGSCTHRGGPLGEGRLDGSIVTCPWHGLSVRRDDGGSPQPAGGKECRGL